MEKKLKHIPKHATRVFRGVIFDVYQWKQKMFDGSYETFEMVARPDTVVLIPIVGDKLLLESQRQPDSKKSFYTFPGGRVDDNEETLKAAKREFLEETGYVSDDWELWFTEKPVHKMDWNISFYIARNCYYQQSPEPDPGEKIKLELIDYERLIKLADEPEFRGKSDLASFLLKARYDEAEKEKLRKFLFR